MDGSGMDGQWREVADEVLSGMKEWRLQHPRASLTEIERALDPSAGSGQALTETAPGTHAPGRGPGQRRGEPERHGGERAAGVPDL